MKASRFTDTQKAFVIKQGEEAKRMLKYTQRSVQTIADEMQFNNIGYFSRFFKRHTGSSPSDYRNNYR